MAVGAVVVKDGALLMVRRGTEPNKGLWTIPGGRVEKGEYLNDAVVREVKEETGIDIQVKELLGILEVVGDPHYVILDHVAIPIGSADITPGDDADEVRWVPVEEVANLDCTPRLHETLHEWGIVE